MAAMTRVEPVPARWRREAFRFLAAGGGDDPLADARAAHLAYLAESGNGSPGRLWWELDRQCVAAAMIVAHPGRTGFLFHCPLGAPGVDDGALGLVVRAATGQAMMEGMYFVQASAPCDDPRAAEAAERWGYRFAAEFLHLSRDLFGSVPPPGPAELSWRKYGQFTEQELGELILSTYVASLDCPLLLPLRPMAEVIAGHKAGGEFRPDSWWIAHWQGAPAGCILVNDRPEESAAEVVYLGVRLEHRGRGLAGRMLLRAAAGAAARGVRRLILAVDARNAPARRAYEKQGFQFARRKWVFAAIRGG